MKLYGKVTANDGKSVTIELVPSGLPDTHREYIERELERVRVGSTVQIVDEFGDYEPSGIGFGE